MDGWISAALIQGIGPAAVDVLIEVLIVAVPCGWKRYYEGWIGQG